MSGEADFDVAIVGAGFSGLWTAHYLKRLRPELRVALVEAEVAGFGASGRNGGWCIGLLAGIEGHLARYTRDDLRWLEPAECEARVRIPGALGAGATA